MCTLVEYGQLRERLDVERAIFAWHPDQPSPLDDVEPRLRVAVLTSARWHHAYECWLASRAWRRKRVAVLARSGFRCERCGVGGGMFAATLLDVHHWRYDRMGDEPLDHLQALCHDCHADADLERAGGRLPDAAVV